MNKLFNSLEKREELQKIKAYILEDSRYEKRRSVSQILFFEGFPNKSGLNILVILRKDKEVKNSLSQISIEKKIYKDKEIKSPVTIIFDSEKSICMYLREQRLFYQEIINNSVTIWQRGKTDIKKVTLGELSDIRIKKLLKEDFKKHWEKIENGFKKFDQSVLKGDFNEASFDLHQITENIFNSLLLISIRYIPNEHNLEKLLDNWISERLGDDVTEPIYLIFPRNNKEEKHLFDVLSNAYKESRENKNFFIPVIELQELFGKINELKPLVKKLCKKKMKE